MTEPDTTAAKKITPSDDLIEDVLPLSEGSIECLIHPAHRVGVMDLPDSRSR